ncbi:MAG TPA: sulfurtransferase FdhD [Gammaproteobacteria bacterium]|nr:sulfurtransferase FdhD [Gammaproteobacteria bacterium]
MTETTDHRYRPQLTHATIDPTHLVQAIDATGTPFDTCIAGESPLTLYVDKHEIVTLMTLGSYPELLALGYLRNQQFFSDLNDIKSVQVDIETHSVSVTTYRHNTDWENKLARRTVTTGCGQGTMFGELMENPGSIRAVSVKLRQSYLYELLHTLSHANDVYRTAGGVHGCALCQGTEILAFIEDVGRHNAVDAISGQMWLEGISGADKLFYTTGRLTSEMVIKTTQMGIPVLLSRSSVTEMGLRLARQAGLTVITRARGKNFLVFNGAGNIIFDAISEQLHSQKTGDYTTQT